MSLWNRQFRSSSHDSRAEFEIHVTRDRAFVRAASEVHTGGYLGATFAAPHAFRV